MLWHYTAGEARKQTIKRSEILQDANHNQTNCQLCDLCQHRTQVVLPDGPKRSVLAVGEAPGAEEDRRGVGFAGIAGTNLDKAFVRAGVQRKDYARTNVVRCRPPQNRRPKRSEVDACASHLEKTIEEWEPAVIIAVGNSAAKRLAPDLAAGSYLPTCERLLQRARQGEFQFYGLRPLLPMPHSSPLAWNRKYESADGTFVPIRELGEEIVKVAVNLANS